LLVAVAVAVASAGHSLSRETVTIKECLLSWVEGEELRRTRGSDEVSGASSKGQKGRREDGVLLMAREKFGGDPDTD
jgi:hypothetical protein